MEGVSCHIFSFKNSNAWLFLPSPEPPYSLSVDKLFHLSEPNFYLFVRGKNDTKDQTIVCKQKYSMKEQSSISSFEY